jgi:hypothetical protein
MLQQRQNHFLRRGEDFNGGIGRQFFALGGMNPTGKSAAAGIQPGVRAMIMSFFKKGHDWI